MKGFSRKEPMFSLCGLNCALCAMHVGGYCPGCGGGEGNQSCAFARCSPGAASSSAPTVRSIPVPATRALTTRTPSSPTAAGGPTSSAHGSWGWRRTSRSFARRRSCSQSCSRAITTAGARACSAPQRIFSRSPTCARRCKPSVPSPSSR